MPARPAAGEGVTLVNMALATFELESEFDVAPESERIEEMKSYQDIIMLLKEKGAEGD